MKYSEKELQVLDIAEKLFAEKGFEGASIRDIAKEVCGNVSIVSYYFGSKENLLLAIFDRKSEELKSHIASLLGNNDLTNLQKINILIDEVLDNLINHQDFHKLLVREEMFNRDSKISSITQEFKKKNMVMIEKIVQDGIDKGEFKNKVNVALMMATLVGTTSQLIVSQQFYAQVAGLQALKSADLHKELKQKIGTYLKTLFKALLTCEM